MEAVCAQCGSPDGLYREVEVTMEGCRSLEVTYAPNGDLKVKEGDTETDLGIGDESPLDYECSECGHHARTIEDLVVPSGQSGEKCCCGHGASDHPVSKKFDKTRYTRGRRSCTVTGCGCWEFETDPVFATVVAA